MTRRPASAALASVMRASISSSDRRRYRSGSGWRSPMLSFSTCVRTRMSMLRRTLHADRRIEFTLRPGDDVVERVALVGLAAGGADQSADRPRGHALRRLRSGHVVDVLFLHRAVEIVGAEPQRELR